MNSRILRWGGGLLLGLMAVGVLLLLARDSILKRIEERSIERNTGLHAEIGELRTRLGSAAFEIYNLRLYNLAEFGGSLLANIPEIAVDLDAGKIADGVLHFRALRLHLSELHVVKNAAGRYNIDSLEKAVRQHIQQRRHRPGHHDPEFTFGGIDQMNLTLRQVRYTDLKRPERWRTLDLGIDDESVTTLKTEADLESWIGSMLFRIVMQQVTRGGQFEPAPPTNGPAPIASP